jgi:anaerobic selenocysteine-containing dehydrogenase
VLGVLEDLGVQMNRDSTLVSYLEKLVWLLTGNFARRGAQHVPSAMVPIGRDRGRCMDDGSRSPMAKAPIISGPVPCNVIAEEILSDHPARYRAMIVESSDPAHSLAGSGTMRKALEALDTLVVIDMAMTETARLADYVLPAPTQYEKLEATFFNFDFPRNLFHLRPPVLPAPDGPLPEPEIHARLTEASGALTDADLTPLRAAADRGRAAFAAAIGDRRLAGLAPVLLYRALGPTLPGGADAAAVLWAAAHRCAAENSDGVRRAGYDTGSRAGERLFEAILTGLQGVVICDDDPIWSRDAVVRGRACLDGAVHRLRGCGSELSIYDYVTAGGTFPRSPADGSRRVAASKTRPRAPEPFLESLAP